MLLNLKACFSHLVIYHIVCITQIIRLIQSSVWKTEIIEVFNYWPHLGHVISTNCDDKHRSNEHYLVYFRNFDCNTKTRLLQAYCTSFYSSELRDLSNKCVDVIGLRGGVASELSCLARHNHCIGNPRSV